MSPPQPPGGTFTHPLTPCRPSPCLCVSHTGPRLLGRRHPRARDGGGQGGVQDHRCAGGCGQRAGVCVCGGGGGGGGGGVCVYVCVCAFRVHACVCPCVCVCVCERDVWVGGLPLGPHACACVHDTIRRPSQPILRAPSPPYAIFPRAPSSSPPPTPLCAPQFKALARITVKPLVETLPCLGGVSLSLLEVRRPRCQLATLLALPFCLLRPSTPPLPPKPPPGRGSGRAAGDDSGRAGGQGRGRVGRWFARGSPLIAKGGPGPAPTPSLLRPPKTHTTRPPHQQLARGLPSCLPTHSPAPPATPPQPTPHPADPPL